MVLWLVCGIAIYFWGALLGPFYLFYGGVLVCVCAFSSLASLTVTLPKEKRRHDGASERWPCVQAGRPSV